MICSNVTGGDCRLSYCTACTIQIGRLDAGSSLRSMGEDGDAFQKKSVKRQTTVIAPRRSVEKKEERALLSRERTGRNTEESDERSKGVLLRDLALLQSSSIGGSPHGIWNVMFTSVSLYSAAHTRKHRRGGLARLPRSLNGSLFPAIVAIDHRRHPKKSLE
jgi:hypothetical protein